MIIITEIISYISNLTGASVGQLPASNALVMQIAPSSSGETFLDGSSSDNMSLLFLCKNTNQQTAITNINGVCNTLTRKKHDNIYNVTIATAPNYVYKDGDYWIYSCIVNIKHYNKEDYNA